MKGTAINNIPNKIFAVFAIIVGGEDESVVISEPEAISSFLGKTPDDVYVLPWVSSEIYTINFQNDDLQLVVDKLNTVISNIEPSDPWVKQTFNVDGIAEGVVYYPVNKTTRKNLSDLSFKAKGEKHKVVKTKDSVQICPEVAKNIEDFVDMFVTDARISQGAEAVGGFDFKNIGQFLQWISLDIQKESEDELEVSGLSWKDVQKSVQTSARSKFLAVLKSV
jgi:hypothetical protein